MYFSVSEEYIPYTFRIEAVCVANPHIHIMIFWALTLCRLVVVYQKLQVVVSLREGDHMSLNMGTITQRTTVGTWGFYTYRQLVWKLKLLQKLCAKNLKSYI